MEHNIKKQKIIRDLFSYSLARNIAQTINFFTATLLRRFLGPYFMGLWDLLKMVLNYAQYTDLGSMQAVSYKYPMLKGSGDEKRAAEIKNSVHNFLIATSVGCMLLVVSYAFIFRSTMKKEVFVGLITVAVLVLVQRMYLYYTTLLRANKDFTVLGKSVVFDAVMNVFMIIFIVRYFRLYGFYFTVLFMPVVNYLFIRTFVNYKLRMTFRMPNISKYVRFGLPLFLITLLKTILASVDRMMIAAMLGVEALGFYSIALMVKGYASEIANNFSHVIVPNFLSDKGKHGSGEKVKGYITTTSYLLSVFLSAMLSGIYIWGPVFVDLVLPKFISGVPAMEIFLITTFFLTIATYPSDYLVSVERQNVLVPVYFMTIGVNVMLNYLFIKWGMGITGVAASTALSSFVMFVWVSLQALKDMDGWSGAGRYLVKNLVPPVYCCLVLLVAGKAISSGGILTVAAIRTAAFATAFLPVLYVADRETGIFSLLKSSFFKKKERS